MDCFSYTGGFGLNALKGGAASVEMVDSSESALAQAKINLLKNGLAEEKAIYTCENVFDYLRKLRDRAETYDLIILDPPKLAPTHAQVEKAARAYKDMNLLAMKLLNPGGILFSFSCSGGVGMDLFKKIIADAAQGAGGGVLFLHLLDQSAAQPIGAAFPEGEYLKGLILAVD